MTESNLKWAAHDNTITAALTRHAAEKPVDPALYFEDDRIGYSDLNHAVNRLARKFQTHVQHGDRLALYLPNSPAFVLLFLAGVRAGCDIQVFDHEWPDSVVRELASNLSSALIVSTHDINADCRTVSMDDTFVPFADVADSFGAPTDISGVAEPSTRTAFYTGFTSGSTGPPKGFRRDHQSWLESFENDQIECPIHPHDTVVAPGALSHSLFLYALLRALHAGSSVVFCRRFSTRNVARVISARAATILYSVPAQLGSLLRRKGSQLSTLRRVFTSGAKWPTGWQDQYKIVFPNAELCEFYGASELSFVAIAKSAESPPIGSVGRAFSGVTIQIKDTAGKPVPTNEHGLVYVKSNMLFLGYADKCHPKPPAEDGSATAGDLGFLDERGFLYLLGRADRMIVVSGKNIYPEEIESCLAAHVAIENAAVIAEPDEKRGQRLIAIIDTGKSATPTRLQLLRHCRQRLPQYKVPSIFALCANWPQTRSSKTDTNTLTLAWRQHELSELT